MKKNRLTHRTALVLFIILALTVFAQAVWWTVFMARLVDEKVDIAQELGADTTYVEQLHSQEIERQIMVGLEGVFFLLAILIGAWLIYRAQVRSEELKFHQQNFLMAVTHELKTPLASMQLYLDSLESDRISLEKKHQVLPRMRQDIARLEAMVQNVLEAGRFERSGYVVELKSVPFSEMVTKAVDKLRAIPSQRKTEVIDEITPGITIQGDAAALQRAVNAILENAVKYNDKDTPQIAVSLRMADKCCILEVSDNGIGIAARDLEKIFDRFYQAGEELTRSGSGSGLGLYLAREIVRAHGGTVRACSDGPGKGAKFTVELKAG
ncbi:MAG TPA: HAMP domain-containing sensor histidine kinase [candidate division Zixibacteria bacterium]|nr:HAMP domain-containing sensor histidine kinase [candidate division Zixibacteria bacterium]